MKPEKPITRKEMYLDVATGGSTELPSPVTREEKYLAKIAGESVDIPTPVTRYEMLLAAVAGESYTPTPVTRLEIYLAKAAGQDVEIPQPVTREEMYWFDYCGGTPTPPEREYTGAVPVTFVADGTPLLDYLISGNTVQNGTPTPDSPIMPQGTGEKTGNLFNKDRTVGIISNVYINQSGEQISSQNYYLSYPIEVLENSVYTWSFVTGTYALHSAPTVAFYDINDELLGAATHDSNIKHFTFTTPLNTKYIRGSVYKGYSQNTTMFLEGGTQIADTASMDYIPYGYKIPISSANTTTPVYLGEVQTTRKIRKLVLTGEETYTADAPYSRFIVTFPNAKIEGLRLTQVYCTHFISVYDGRPISEVPNNSIYSSDVAVDRFFIKTTDYTSATGFKAFLAAQYAAGTPVTVWYVLATEETAVVNEPLMKIGDYADTLSMEQAGVQIPTANGSTTLGVETTVKPSEVYIKYRGEAVATLSTLSAEVSSPEAIPAEENPEETEEEENGSEDVSL